MHFVKGRSHARSVHSLRSDSFHQPRRPYFECVYSAIVVSITDSCFIQCYASRKPAEIVISVLAWGAVICGKDNE